MDNNEKWEKLINLPDEYAGEPTLADRAIAEIENAPAQEKGKSWFSRHWRKITAIAVPVVLVVGIGLPVYIEVTTPEPPPIIYYDAADLAYEEVTDVAAFVQEKGLSVGYFSESTLTTQYGFIQDTEEAACLVQKGILLGFDEIQFTVVLLSNLELDFQETYERLEGNTIVENISVAYEVNQTTELIPRNQIFAKFSHGGAEYYLDIVTESEEITCINTYVGMLIG